MMPVVSPFNDADYPADPYPGARPDTSYVHLNQYGWAVEPDRTTASGWAVVDYDSHVDLDEWLTLQEAAPIEERWPILAYGSNACPSKVTWLRHTHGLDGPAVVMRARVEGAAAVWAAGTRARDGQRPAVLAANPGITETHAVWWATHEQRRAIDQGEGRGERYRLSWVQLPVHLDDGSTYTWVLAYTARPEVIGKQVPIHLNRSPLLHLGQLVRVADLGQTAAVQLPDDAANTDGLTCVEVSQLDPSSLPS